MRLSKTLSRCQRTTIREPLLYDLLVGDLSRHIPGQVNFLASGHGRHDAARHILCYVVRRALGIVRLPGTYDLKLRNDFFQHLKPEQLEAAVEEAKRIYEHTQSELKRVWGENTIPLVRGTRAEESSAIDFLLNKLKGETVPLYLNTLTFFNHESGAFSGDFKVSIDCPIEWIWANEYTLEMIKHGGTCEEFIVACTDPSGMIELPRSAFETRITSSPFEPLPVTGLNGRESPRELIGHALAGLVHEGLEPDGTLRYSLEYSPGTWEKRFLKWAGWLINLGRRWDSKSEYRQARVNKRLLP